MEKKRISLTKSLTTFADKYLVYKCGPETVILTEWERSAWGGASKNSDKWLCFNIFCTSDTSPRLALTLLGSPLFILSWSHKSLNQTRYGFLFLYKKKRLVSRTRSQSEIRNTLRKLPCGWPGVFISGLGNWVPRTRDREPPWFSTTCPADGSDSFIPLSDRSTRRRGLSSTHLSVYRRIH